MKTTAFLCRLGLLIALTLPASAQVTNYAVFKVTVYHQVDTMPPTVPDFPNAYYFGAQLNLTASNYYDSASFFWTAAPLTSTAATNLALALVSPYNYNYGSPFYTTKAAFDADFGPGDYEVEGLFTNLSYDSGIVTIPNPELYATNLPAFSPSAWSRMQQVDPAQDLALELNSFAVVPGATEAPMFLNVFDPAGISPANYYTNGVSLLVTNVLIPANTLEYGVNYEADLFFSSRTDTPNAGFNGATAIMGFDDLTYASVATIPPPLWIASSGTNVVLSWPSLASNFILQGSTNLLDPAGWLDVTNIVQPPGLTNSAVFPAMGKALFYRLAQGGGS